MSIVEIWLPRKLRKRQTEAGPLYKFYRKGKLMYREAKRPAWAEVNLSNLDYNIKNIRSITSPNAEIIGIVKADGYGHGAYETVQALQANGVSSFGVATLQEAIDLREKGVAGDIIILSLTPDIYADFIVEYDVIPVTCSYGNALAISQEAKKRGKTVCGFVAADTGMGRIGLLPDDPNSVEAVKRISMLPNFKIKGLFSHFATADVADKSYAEEQTRRFSEFCGKLRAEGVVTGLRTFASSAAIMEMPSSHCEAVRPGIIIYGCYPSDEVDRGKISLKPAMSVKASIVQLKKLPAGESVSYGREFVAKRESLIATINIGYSDGLIRAYSPTAKVIVGGSLAPVAGTICMDQCMIDVTDVPGVETGDEVIIMGSDGENAILADDIARATGTISYEILCAFGQRLPKVYIR